MNLKKRLTKNGFTLMELIATIVILVIVLLVAIPMITSSIEKRKTTELEDKKKLLAQAGEIYIGSDYQYLTVDSCYITIEDLQNKRLVSNSELKTSNGDLLTGYITFNKNTYEYEYTNDISDLSKCSEVIVKPEINNETDTNLPNDPDLFSGLIAITYDEDNSRWVKADITNTNNTWYDYSNKKWANAVLVTSPNRETYEDAIAGTVINEEDILAYYVWIPRYKYKVWNIDKLMGTDSYSYDAYNNGIDIVFENETETTGTITCSEYSYADITSDNQLSQTCTGSNGEYYTHPAFTFGNDELTGIWVGKFELSSESPTSSRGGGQSVSLTPRILPNVAPWRYNYITNFYKVISDMQVTNNIYGLSTNILNISSHMIKNMEWGAIAYFTHSKYGRCTSG